VARPQTAAEAKRRGDFPTPHPLVAAVVEANLPPAGSGGTVRVLDPACGDGRFLVAAGRAVAERGATAHLYGVDIDEGAVHAARSALDAAGFTAALLEHDDALRRSWGEARFHLVIGNPPFLSQLASATTRGRASEHGGGPYADACAEFLALAVRLAEPDGGRIAFVLPQSILASRDAGPVRAQVDRLAELTWSWWSPQRVFPAQVHVCALGFRRRTEPWSGATEPWQRVVTAALGVPDVPPLAATGTLGDRVVVSANFRDEYYGLIPAVVDGGAACDLSATPPLVTSGLVDPGRCRWGERPVTFAKHRLDRPRVRLELLGPALRRWADGLLVPKVLVANQTRVIEAVADVEGAWLPSVPVITGRPREGIDVRTVAAILTSPVASAWAWHRAAGTGLSATTLRLGPRWLTELPWPAGDAQPAADALAAGDVVECGRRVLDAYAVDHADGSGRSLLTWWCDRLPT